MRSFLGLAFLSFVAACASGEIEGWIDDVPSAPSAANDAAAPETVVSTLHTPESDAALHEAPVDACASTTAEVKRERAPVDIVWIVDNSASMQLAVAEVESGLNAFASRMAAKGFDYRVVMLSLKGTGPVTANGKKRYPVCIPPPLGGADCANGPRFLHASLDVKSTQPLEQLLGTLGQTQGYRQGDERGSDPWAQFLRPNATKTFVVVTDDDSRLSAAEFESFPGGQNPKNEKLVLPPGLLDPSRGAMMAGYSLSAIYGWGSPTDPSVKCVYPDGSEPSSAGATYTTLVSKTGGARARICDGHDGWTTFFDAVASAVEKHSRTTCSVDVPTTSSGALDPDSVNVRAGGRVPSVAGPSACAGGPGWHFDDATAPKKVILCPATCESTQPDGGSPPATEVMFGCKTVHR